VWALKVLKAWEIATKTGWAYLRVFIEGCHRKIDQLDEVVQNVNSRELKHVGRQHDGDGQNKFLQINDSKDNLS
jgi:hypothetical protein